MGLDMAQTLGGQIGGGQQWSQKMTPPREDYANRVDIERGEHDATLSFYRDGKSTGKLIKAITIPLSVLDLIKEA